MRDDFRRPQFEDDTADLQSTEHYVPRNLPPQAGQQRQAGQYQPSRFQGQAPPPPPPVAPRGFHLPLWSVVLMLLGVFVVTGAIVGLVYLLGGNFALGGTPQVVIVTAQPTDIPLAASPRPPVATAAPAQFEQGINQASGTVPTFALEGPLLPTIYLSPTPAALAIGQIVEVINVGTSGLNVRNAPGINNAALFVAPTGNRFTIIAGPERADDLTWWQLQAADGRTGWAAENDNVQDLLAVVPPATAPNTELE